MKLNFAFSCTCLGLDETKFAVAWFGKESSMLASKMTNVTSFCEYLEQISIQVNMNNTSHPTTIIDGSNVEIHHSVETEPLDLNYPQKKTRISTLNNETTGKEIKQLCMDVSKQSDPVINSTSQSGNDAQLSFLTEEGQKSKEQKCELNDSTNNTSPCSLKSLPNTAHHLLLIEAGIAEDKGSRHQMEDAWVLLPDAGLDSPGKMRCAHFAIYDGHGGRLAAEFVQKHLHANVLSAGLPRELMDVKAAKKAILEGFRRTDESLLEESLAGGWQDGATAVCVWILDKTVFVANIGDAKAVLACSSASVELDGNDGNACEPLKAIVMTREHKAIYPQERARIQKVGGFVSSNGRLQGRLEVSRAFGDRQFKKVGVISTPDVHSFELTGRERFIILGCDGLWGVFGTNDAVEFVQQQLKDGLTPTAICRRLVREAVRERRCKDNCTAIIIILKHQSLDP